MIEVEALTKTFMSGSESVAAVDCISFEVAAGEIVTLLGPSGCGKTTTLRTIAGLERPSAGRIAIGGRTMVDAAANVFVPPHRRQVGMVFQSYAIWPHMTVLENVAYALEGRRLGRAEVRRQAMLALERVHLAHLADRPAPRLSGGQQQRVAIARAIAGSPVALLFDEPLSNLDAKLRAEMRKELRRLQRDLGFTSVYVTHDQAEALSISDWVIVMRDGHIVERGRPTEIYSRPRHVFTAQFLGSTNLLSGRVETVDSANDRVAVATLAGRLVGTDPGASLTQGSAVAVSIRPEDFEVVKDGSAAPEGYNVLAGKLTFAVFAGAMVEAEIKCGDNIVQALLSRDTDVTPGRDIVLAAPARLTVILAQDEPAADKGGGK
jgi:ABC-type Fe3+/spermidine/putrescine transport system ATPase subunit